MKGCGEPLYYKEGEIVICSGDTIEEETGRIYLCVDCRKDIQTQLNKTEETQNGKVK